MSAASPDIALTPLGNEPVFEGGAQEIAPRTWAWIQPNGDLGESNTGLLVGDGRSILIDTLWDERLTRRMLDALAPARAGAPITRLINTHGDGDHWYGNGLFGRSEIVATEAAAEQMEDEPPSMLTRMNPLTNVTGALSGVPLIPGKARIRGLGSFAEMLARYDFDGLEPRLPTRTFSGRTSVGAGGRRVEVIEVGPAHTPGDAIVWAQDVRVVFSGDIVFNGVTPIMWAGPAGNWVAALDRIEALDPVAVVPGHGPVCDLGPVRDLREYWRYLIRHVPKGAGKAIVELTEELVRGIEYRTSPWGEWRAPERTLVNVAMIARERDGEQGPVGLAKRIGLISEMGALRERLAADRF